MRKAAFFLNVMNRKESFLWEPILMDLSPAFVCSQLYFFLLLHIDNLNVKQQITQVMCSFLSL